MKIILSLIPFLFLCGSLFADFSDVISMPKDYNPLVDNHKSIEVAQKKFKELCMSPTDSQMESFKLLKSHSLCGVASLPSEEACNDIKNCYISKYARYSLYKFSITDTDLSDLSPFKYFKSSRNFVLNSNKIKDLSPLAELKNIESLDLVGNPIDNLKPLVNLNLKSLRLLDTPVKDLSPLEHMTSLRLLTLGEEVEDLSPLKNLKKLYLLSLTSKNITDICEIENLTSLDSLSIRGGGVSDISCLKDLTNIDYLYLKDIPLKDLTVLKHFKKLKFLTLNNVPVESIDSLDIANNSLKVELINTKVKDLSVLLKLKKKGLRVYIDRDSTGNPLVRCSPKNDNDLDNGKSCYEDDGVLKPIWKRWIGL